MRRIIDKSNKEEIIELLKAGLMKRLNEIIGKAIQLDNGAGIMIVVGEIVELLIRRYPIVCGIITDKIKFID